MDLCDDESVARGVERTRALLGPIDVLVNDAGVAHQAPFLELEPSNVREEIELNYLGVVRTVRAVLEPAAGRSESPLTAARRETHGQHHPRAARAPYLPRSPRR